MIDALGRVMLYVKNPKAMTDFWVEKVGFVLLGQEVAPADTTAFEVAPSAHSDTSFMLYNRAMIARLEPELSLDTPSILFSSYDLQKTYEEFGEKGIPTGNILTIQTMKTFNFSDPEGNWFAIREVEKRK